MRNGYHNPSGCHPVWTIGAPASVIRPFFTPNALSATTLPIYPGLEHAGLHAW